MLFRDWSGLLRILSVAPLAYAILVLALRIGGKRTLAKMNAFDLVVTVALGSTLSSVITSKQLPFAEGALALVLLVVLQGLVSWSAVRVAPVAKLMKSEPRLLFHRGGFLDAALREERLLREEVYQAMRSQGHLTIASVEAVVLETNGRLSVISTSSREAASTLEGVKLLDSNGSVG